MVKQGQTLQQTHRGSLVKGCSSKSLQHLINRFYLEGNPLLGININSLNS